MDQDDPERRIAELERQLAEQKRIAELERQLADAKAAAAREARRVEGESPAFDAHAGTGEGAVDEYARRHAEALLEGLRTGGPSTSEAANLRAAVMRAAAGAGMSEPQINDALQNAQVTIKTGHSVVYPQQRGPLNFDARAGSTPLDSPLAPPPRRIPVLFGLAELLPFRWRYVWLVFMIGIAPIALWMHSARAFALVAVLTMVAIYAFSFWGASKRFALLRWGQVATVTDSNVISRGTYYSGTTYMNARLPVAHGWKVERPWYSGPNTKTLIRYSLNGQQGELKVSGRQYDSGVVLADPRKPARALCVTSFPYDLDRTESGNWIGRLRPGLMVGMAAWLIIVTGWLGTAAVVVTKGSVYGREITDWLCNNPHIGVSGLDCLHTDDESSRAFSVPQGGDLTVEEEANNKTIPCNDGNLTVDGVRVTVSVTGHCAKLTVKGVNGHVTVDRADAIDIDGLNNLVIFHSGSPNIIPRGGVGNNVRQG